MDSVANGLSSLISSVTTSFDSRAEATSRSQEELAFALDRLTGELDKLLEDAPSPFIMQHAKRISGVRKRVTSLNSVLKSIQRRIDNMDRMLSAASSEAVTEQSVRERENDDLLYQVQTLESLAAKEPIVKLNSKITRAITRA